MAQGDVVGERYHLLERLDAGGMGEVWKAGDARLGGKIVAVKRVPVDDTRAVTENDIDLFRREALAASQLRHRNAVAVTDFFVDAGAPFIVMEYVDGQTLGSLVRAGGLSAAEVARLGTDVAAALATAHAAGLTHRDVKPDNVIVRPDGSPVLVDFGIARAAEDSRLTTTGLFRGTLRYVAPEILDGAVAGPASDVWSLGATLFELLTGTSPFDGPTSTAIMAAILVQPIPTAGAGPLGELIAELLDRDPARRPSAAQASARLGSLAASTGATTITQVVDRTPSPAVPDRPNPLRVFVSRATAPERALLAAALLGLVFSFFDFYGYRPSAVAAGESDCATGLYPAGSGSAGLIAVRQLCSPGGATTSAWHGFFGWVGVLLLLIGALTVAVAVRRRRTPLLANFALAVGALAAVSEIVAGLSVPPLGALRDVLDADQYGETVSSSGVRWSYWVVLVLAVVAAAAALLTRFRSGRPAAPRPASQNG